MGYLSSSATVDAIDFTGQHRCVANFTFDNNLIGMICVSTGKFFNLDSSVNPKINESLPIVQLSTGAEPNIKQKNVFGVISGNENNGSEREYITGGSFVSVFNKNDNQNRLYINSVGEGGIWVTNNGNMNNNILNGDYITTSKLSGYGTLQEDDILHNYTVAKSTQTIIWNDIATKKDNNILSRNIVYNNVEYLCAFIGCTYHCG